MDWQHALVVIERFERITQMNMREIKQLHRSILEVSSLRRGKERGCERFLSILIYFLLGEGEIAFLLFLIYLSKAFLSDPFQFLFN